MKIYEILAKLIVAADKNQDVTLTGEEVRILVTESGKAAKAADEAYANAVSNGFQSCFGGDISDELPGFFSIAKRNPRKRQTETDESN